MIVPPPYIHLLNKGYSSWRDIGILHSSRTLEHSPLTKLALSKEVYVYLCHIIIVISKITYLNCAIWWKKQNQTEI